MNEDEIWETAKKPVTEFVDAIKEMRANVDKLVKFYLKHASSMKSRSQLEPNTSSQIKQGQQSASDQDQTNQDNQTLSPLACAKLELAIVFAINTCYWLYVVTDGKDPSKNVISKDLERVRLFMNRAKEVDELLSETGPCTKKAKTEPQQEEQW